MKENQSGLDVKSKHTEEQKIAAAIDGEETFLRGGKIEDCPERFWANKSPTFNAAWLVGYKGAKERARLDLEHQNKVEQKRK